MQDFFSSARFMARGECGEWDPTLAAIYLGSHLAIYIAYIVMPTIFWVAMRVHAPPVDNVSENERARAKLALGLFVLLCGIGHLEGVLSWWYPAYHVFAIWHAITAVVSWWAVYVLFSFRARLLSALF